MVSPVLQGRTRRQLRESIGYNVLGSDYIVSTATSNGTATTLIDVALQGSDKAGGWIIFRDGTDDGTIVRVTADNGSGTLTFTPAVNTDSVASGDAYEWWQERYDPLMLHSIMNDAMTDATGRVYDPEESVFHHLHSDAQRYAIESQFDMISALYERVDISGILIDPADVVWGTIHASTIGSADQEVKRRGNASLKLVTGDQADGDILAAQTITDSPLNLSKYTHIEYWARSTTTQVAADYEIVLKDAGGTEETLSSAAIGTADNWEYQSLAFASPEDNTAITSIEIVANHTSNLDSKTLNFDEFRVIRNDTAQWQTIHPNRWSIDKQARDLVFKLPPRYRLLKMVGGGKPALFSDDTSTTEIDDWYVITFTANMIKAQMAETGAERAQYMQIAREAKRAFPILRNVRTVS